MIQPLNAGKTFPASLQEGETGAERKVDNRSWDPFSTPAEYAHQSWQISSEVSGSIVIFNTHTNSYITVPSSKPSSISRSPPAHSQLLDLTAGVNPSDNLDAQVYGGVPGSSKDEHMQWVIIQNNDNSIRYYQLIFPFFSIAFS
jgi:hypothetical protein